MTDENKRYVKVAVGGFVVVVLGVMFTSCLCGHLSWVSLLFTGGGSGMVWVGYYRLKDGRLSVRMCLAVAAILCTYTLLQTIHNILWSGHDPLL